MSDGMEMRNGTWTSRTRARDVDAMAQLAGEIGELSNDPQIQEKAQRISNLARSLKRDL